MKELTDNPEKIWTLLMVISTAIPIVIFVIRWFFKVVKSDVEKNIMSEFKQNNEDFKAFIRESQKLTSDQMKFLERSMENFRDDTQELFRLMNLHIDEVGHWKEISIKTRNKVDIHEQKIIQLEKTKA